MSKTVFVSNKSSVHDYSPATMFGALRYVTLGNYAIFKTNRLREEIVESLVYSRPDDFLLPSGSAVIAALCTTTWLEMHGSVQLLLWDRSQSQYVTRVIGRSDIRLEIENARQRLNIVPEEG